MKLAPFVRQFLVNYLPHIKGASPYTVKTYRDAFKLFLPFAAQYHGIKIKSLRVEHISSELILAFLNALEKERKNQPKTRNQRLAALKSFAKMLRFLSPQNRNVAERILHPPKTRPKTPHRLSLPPRNP